MPISTIDWATSTTEAVRGEVDLLPSDSSVIATHLGHIRALFCACRAGRSEAARFFCVGGAMQVYAEGAVFCLWEGSVAQVQRLRR